MHPYPFPSLPQEGHKQGQWSEVYGWTKEVAAIQTAGKVWDNKMDVAPGVILFQLSTSLFFFFFDR